MMQISASLDVAFQLVELLQEASMNIAENLLANRNVTNMRNNFRIHKKLSKIATPALSV